ncbi:helix-turn-helix domain-containing protein [Acidobacteriota bacterium]
MPGESNFGRFIRTCRQYLGYSLRKVAQLSEEEVAFERITPGNLAMIERGKHIPSFAKILTLARIYNVPLRFFEEHYWMNHDEETLIAKGRSLEKIIEEGWRCLDTGRLDEAYARFRSVTDRLEFSKSPDGTMFGQALLGAALCLFRKGHFYTAREELEKVLGQPGLSTEVKARAGLILAQIYQSRQNPIMARMHARQALKAAREEGRREWQARILLILAELDQDMGDGEKAVSGFRRALRKTPKGTQLQAEILRKTAQSQERLGEHSLTETLLTEAMEVAVATGAALEAAKSQRDLAAFMLTRNRYREAHSLARGCLCSARDLHNNGLEHDALTILHKIAEFQQDSVRAREYDRTLKRLKKKLKRLPDS